jgi:hypothetical protein
MRLAAAPSSAVCNVMTITTALMVLHHLLPQALYALITMAIGRDPRRPSNGTKLSTGDGTITILPYAA